MPGASKSSYSLLERVKPPATRIVQQALEGYLERTGMTPSDLAPEMAVGESSLRHFLNGTYAQVAARDDFVRAKTWDFIQRYPLADDTGDIPAKLLRTRDTRTILGLAEEARRKGRVIIIEGPPGTSKTTALRWYAQARNEAQKRDALYLRSWLGITGVALLRSLCRLLGANTCATREGLLRNAVRKLKLRAPVVLLIDEAQHLLYNRAEAFEQLRDVLDLSGCGCLLAGHFNFVKALTNGLGRDLEQWISRNDLHVHLRGLDKDDLVSTAEEFLGEPLPADVRKALVGFALARDRNALARSAFLLLKGERLPIRYLSIRRVRKFFDRIEELRQLEANQGQPLGALARGALKLLLVPEGRAL